MKKGEARQKERAEALEGDSEEIRYIMKLKVVEGRRSYHSRFLAEVSDFSTY